MDRILALLGVLVGLAGLTGAILVHTNSEAQRSEVAAEIAQLRLSVGLATKQQPTIAPLTPAGEPPLSEYVAGTPLPVALAPIEPAPAESAASSSEPSAASSTFAAPAPLQPPAALQAPASSEAPSSAEPVASSSASEPPPSSSSTEPAGDEVDALKARIAELEQLTKDQATQLAAAQAQIVSLQQSTAQPPPTQVAAVNPPSSATPNASVLSASGPTTDCIPLGTRFMATSGDNFPICRTKMVVKIAAVSDGFASINGAGDVATGALGDLGKGCHVMVFSADTSGYAEMRVTCQ